MGVEGGIPSRRQAHVFQINLSPGGVPKEAVPQARLGFLGFEGDGHNDSELHGGPERAVCLYSLEHFLALQREGHPIYPGAIGENLTISGLDWPQLTPGMRLGIGDETVVEVTSYTSPCSTIKAAFRDEVFTRISQKIYPGWSRVYARVITTGIVRVGDRVEIETLG